MMIEHIAKDKQVNKDLDEEILVLFLIWANAFRRNL